MKTRCANSFVFKTKSIHHGFSLVELLVSLAISMVVVTGAAYVYLSTSQTQRVLSEKALATETAHYVMDVLGRDIENSGFYPTIRVAGSGAVTNVTIEAYQNPVQTSPIPVAYNAPVFGCKAQTYKAAVATLDCADHTGTVDADTLMLNSYSNDSYGLDIGNRADCLRQDSANDPVNALRKNATNVALTPLRPLFVSNRYTLTPVVMQIEGQNINTFSLSCNGNGIDPSGNTYQPMVAGVDQLRFYYLIRTSDTSTSKFQRADAVAAADWPNVVSIRVCLMARSMQAAKLQGSSTYSIKDCDGVDKSFTDGVERRIFTQVFALKNQNQILNVQ